MEIPLPISLVSMLFSATINTSIAANGTGEWHFGPDVSENFACQKAETLARIDAIRSVVGENIFIDEFYQCKEVNDERKCASDTAMFSMTDSYVKRITARKRDVRPTHFGKTCTVDLEVKVTTDRPKIDAFVDGRFMYKNGESMQFKMATNKPTKVYMFHIEGKKATMMWPTFVGTNNNVTNELTVPTQGYKMIARASKFDESIVFVFSNEDLNFMRDYDVNDLNAKLLSIPIADRRIVRRNLVIEQ
jgi:hypothetical protein